MSKNVELLKGLFGDQVVELNEEQTNTLSTKLEKLIEARADAKVKFQTEILEAEAKEKYNTLLTEATQKYETTLKEVETKTLEKATEYKTKLQEKFDGSIKHLKEGVEKDSNTFKEMIVEKLDKYLALELDKKVPDSHIDALAKVSIYEPIVNGFKKIMEENYIKIDEENFGLIKDAREEIIKVREELAEAVKENMELNSNLGNYKRSVIISEVCEGLTDAQRKRALKLLEGCDSEEVKEKFNSIRDFIIEDNGNVSADELDLEKEGKEDSEVSSEEEAEGSEDVLVSPEKKKKTDEAKKDLEKETEADVCNVPESTSNVSSEKELIESWAKEFRRLSR